MKLGIMSFAHMHAYSYAKGIQQVDGVELAAVWDEDRSRGEEMASEFGASFYADYTELLSQDIDAVIVTSENAKHYQHVLAAASFGKHILCEKPLAINVGDAQEMIDGCKEKGVVLQTAFPVRFNTVVERAKQMIDEGQLGRIMAIRGTNRGVFPDGWFVEKELSGGGAVMDHTVHVVDIMRWFMGAEINEVYAEVDHRINNGPIDDCGILTFEFDNGVFATLDCSWSRNKTFPTWGDVTIEVVGLNGTLSIDAFAQKVNVYNNENGVEWDYWGDDMDTGLVRDFVQTIKEGRTPSITGLDGLRALEAVLAAYESAEKNEPVHV
jgi:UDP-N-acetylglucosamine 3-dehydrogenase